MPARWNELVLRMAAWAFGGWGLTTSLLGTVGLSAMASWLLLKVLGPPTVEVLAVLGSMGMAALLALWIGIRSLFEIRSMTAVVSAALWQATLTLALGGLVNWLAFFDGADYVNPGIAGLWFGLAVMAAAAILSGVLVGWLLNVRLSTKEFT